MRIIDNLDEMTETARGWLSGGSVGFVPTRGHLHAGHGDDRPAAAPELRVLRRRLGPARRRPAGGRGGSRVHRVTAPACGASGGPRLERRGAATSRRVAQGGHDVPAEVIRRRFKQGWRNFQNIYRELVDSWQLYDNSGERAELIEEG